MKILHTADIHLGSNTYGRVDPQSGLNTRLLDFRRAFESLVQRGLDEDIDLFLFAGDAYRTADPTPTQQQIFAECLKPIADRGIPIVMVVGNHDHPVSFGKASALDIFSHLTGDIHVFRRPDLQRIETKSGPLQLIALPWPIRSMLLTREDYRKMTPPEVRGFIEEKYVRYLDLAVSELDPSLPTVLAAHLTVQGAEMSGSEQTSLIAHEPKFTVGQLARPGIDYVALGHIHRYQDRNAGATPPIVYCGSIECISFKEWEDHKGFVLVDIEDDGSGSRQTRYTFVETRARPFIAVEVDLRDAVDPTEAVVAAIRRHDVQDAIVRIRYRIEEAQAPQVDIQRIREALQPAYGTASIERVVDPTERRRRTVVTRESTLEEALRRYVAQHENLASIEEALVERALTLEAEYEAAQKEDT